MASSEFEAFMEQIRNAETELAKARENLERVREENRPRLQRHHEQIVKARRAGEMGTAWQVLQSRIDLGKTCESDIFNGIDKSPEACEVRADLVRKMTRLRDDLDALDSEDDVKQDYLKALAAREEFDESRSQLSNEG